MKRLAALTFRQLRALDSVVRTGSISRAAEELGLTAPAVHSQLKSLEDNFGCALLSRHGVSGFQPTPEGDVLLDAYRRARAGFELAIRRIDGFQKGFSGTVILGVVSTGKYFAPGLVARLREAYPDIEVVLKIGNRDFIVQALQDTSVDLAIMGRPPRDPAVVATAIGEHPHVLIAPPGHPLAHKAAVMANDVLSQPIIMREQGSGTRILATRYLDRIGEGLPYQTTEMGSNETIKQAVIAGLGIAMISQHTVTEEIKAGRLVRLNAPGLPIVRHWFLLYREDLVLTGAMQRVRDFISAQNGNFLPKMC